MSVIDTGMGISEEDIPKLFGLFEKLDSTKEQNKSGTGLGLMISHKLAKKLSPDGSGIKVESVLHEGSTFSFLLEDKPFKAKTKTRLTLQQQ